MLKLQRVAFYSVTNVTETQNLSNLTRYNDIIFCTSIPGHQNVVSHINVMLYCNCYYTVSYSGPANSDPINSDPIQWTLLLT